MDYTNSEKKIGRLRASYLLTVESFEYLRKDKEILGFVGLSTLCNILLMLVIGGLIAVAYVYQIPGFSSESASDETYEIGMYAILLVWYLGAAFIVTFFQGALSTVVYSRIQGGEPTFKDGMDNAKANTVRFFMWALLSATVGVALRVIGDKLGFVGKLFGAVGEVAWSLLSFFIVPVLALEKRSIKDSFVRSAEVFKATWGESLIMNFSVGLFFGMLSLGALLVGILLMVVVSQSLLAVAFVMLLLILAVLGLGILSSTLNSVFRVVLYVYASTGRVPDSFTPELIIGAVKRKDKPAIT